MRFATLADAFATFEKESGNALRASLAEFFQTVPADGIKKAAYLSLGAIASDYDDVNLGMADKAAIKAVAAAFDVKERTVLAAFKQKGDIGLVAMTLAPKRRASLSVDDVWSSLHAIADTSGTGSQEAKQRLLIALLRKATSLEACYVVRLAVGKLRMGVAAKTVLDGLAGAFAIDRDVMDRAFNVCPDIGVIAETAAKNGAKGIGTIGVLVGRPVQMMLCQRVKLLSDVFKRMGPLVAAEQKYDGERVQVHKAGGRVRLYSRRLEDITHQFPEVVAAIRALKVTSLIVEGEVMAVAKDGSLLPFQTLMGRRRKHGIEQAAKDVPVRVFCFDLLFLDGKSLIDTGYVERYRLLTGIARPGAVLDIARRVVCEDVDCIEELFNAVVGKGGEGVVIKSLRPDSKYQAGVRGWHWIKWKPEYAKGMQDTFDLVVIGAFWGRGRRSGAFGALLCAVYNPMTGLFESVCKVGSGFSDADLASLSKKVKRVASMPKQVVVTGPMTPDVWVEPSKVVEVLAAEVTRSPFHAAGRGSSDKGFALRFPRFVRWRTDKTAEQATTTDEIARMAR